MTFIVATHNARKLKEFKRILEPLSFGAVIREDLPEVEEAGTTLAENALLKAESARKATGMPATADNSDLAVDASDDALSVYSVRYADEGVTDRQRYEKLLEELHEVPTEQRTARFVSAICCVFPGGKILTAGGTCEGIIAFGPEGKGGSGYDPIFLVGERSYVEMMAEEKDNISHRGRALVRSAQELENWKKDGQNKEVHYMITSRQRASLYSIANPLDTILMIGKDGMSDDIMKQADDAFTVRELIKGKVLETVGIAMRQAADKLTAPLSAEVVQAIGGKFVLYRKNQEEPEVVLPRPTKK